MQTYKKMSNISWMCIYISSYISDKYIRWSYLPQLFIDCSYKWVHCQMLPFHNINNCKVFLRYIFFQPPNHKESTWTLTLPDPVFSMVRRSISSAYTNGCIHLFGLTCKARREISDSLILANGFLLIDMTTAFFSGQPNFCVLINLVFLMRQGA